MVRSRPCSLASSNPASASRTRSVKSLPIVECTSPKLAVNGTISPAATASSNGSEALDRFARRRDREFRVDDDELVTAKAPNHIGTAHVLGHDGGEHLQGPIAGLVPEPVVDRLEPVEVGEHDDERGALSEQPGDVRFDHLPIGKASQPVGARLTTGELEGAQGPDVAGGLGRQGYELVAGGSVGGLLTGTGQMDHPQRGRVERHRDA